VARVVGLIALATLAVVGGVLAYVIPGAGASSLGCKNGHGHGCTATVTTTTTGTTTPPPPGPCGTTGTHPQTYAHVLWIFMENKAYSQVIGSSSAPFTNQLARQCGLATNYTATTHPSLPNYIAATSGDFWGIADDNPPSSHTLGVASIYSQLKAVGKTWRDYEESAPSNCPLASSGQYAVKHDPAPYYTGIRSDCSNWDVPMGTTTSGNLLDDLNANTLPDFAFLTPNLCNDTHDCSVATGDSWLSAWFNIILASAAYKAGSTAIFLTYDEDDGSASNRVVTIVVSPSTPAGTSSGTAFSHYSLLKTTEQMLGLGLLAHAGDAGTTSMRSAFNL
jgi:phospholipase C